MLRWLSGHLAVLVRLILASVLTIWVALPLAKDFVEKVGGEVASKFTSVFPLSVVRIVATPVKAEEKKGTTGQKAVKAEPAQTGEEEEKEATSAAPRVVAYGIQIAGLLVALGGTLWAIVALSHND